MLRYMTAGESHGKTLMGILEGMPSNLFVDIGFVDAELARRQCGYGRGGRMQIESDRAEFVAGIRGGKTTGAPIGFLIANRDWENWKDVMGADATKTEERTLTAVRPGHADYAGCVKYAQTDARNILERASARATAAQVVVGAIAKSYLKALGIEIGSHTVRIGEIADCNRYTFDEIATNADASIVRVLDGSVERDMIKAIDDAMANGDTLGGELRVIAHGVPVGIGSHIAPDKRLEYALSGHLAAIGSVKCVAVGDICACAHLSGANFHDALHPSKHGKIQRKTNRAGGIEGGISNGEDIEITLSLKPIPSVPSGIATVDILTHKATLSARERGDACVVAAAGVVAEAVVAYVLASAIAESLGGDHMAEVVARMTQKRSEAI